MDRSRPTPVRRGDGRVENLVPAPHCLGRRQRPRLRPTSSADRAADGCRTRAPRAVSITVLIDSPPTARYHVATVNALRYAMDDRLAIDVVRTDSIDKIGDGVVIGPGTPYRDPRAAEDVITDARARGIPLVAT